MAFEINCGGCGATNRVSAERLDDQPKCGRCGDRLETKVSASEAQRVEQLFQQVFSHTGGAGESTTPPAGAPSSGTRSAIYHALRNVGFDSSQRTMEDRGQKIRAGVCGVLLGGPLTVLGVLAGTALMNAILGLFGAQGSVTMPTVVLAAAYAGALYGFMVVFTGTERLLGGLFPASSEAGIARVLRLFALVAVGASLLLAVWWIVHTLGLADFTL